MRVPGYDMRSETDGETVRQRIQNRLPDQIKCLMRKPVDGEVYPNYPEGYGPGSGRTSAIINAMVDNIIEGAPGAVFVGISRDWNMNYAWRILIRALKQKGVKHRKCRGGARVVIPPSQEIVLISVEDYVNGKVEGVHFSEFWDHACVGEV